MSCSLSLPSQPVYRESRRSGFSPECTNRRRCRCARFCRGKFSPSAPSPPRRVWFLPQSTVFSRLLSNGHVTPAFVADAAQAAFVDHLRRVHPMPRCHVPLAQGVQPSSRFRALAKHFVAGFEYWVVLAGLSLLCRAFGFFTPANSGAFSPPLARQ